MSEANELAERSVTMRYKHLMILAPVTRAERTVYWFLHGRRNIGHKNCRCVSRAA